MLEAQQDTMQMAMNAQSGQRFADDRVYAQFFLHPKKDEAASLEEGRDIFIEIPYVKIMVPGDKDNIVVRPVRDQDKQRFPRQWQAFQNNEEEPMNGTPLTEWAFINRGQVEELKYFGIRTIEDLANSPDSQTQKFMGIASLKQKAKMYLEDSKLQAPLDKLQAENDTLKAQMADMLEQIKELQKPKPRRRKVDVQDSE